MNNYIYLESARLVEYVPPVNFHEGGIAHYWDGEKQLCGVDKIPTHFVSIDYPNKCQECLALSFRN